jgi:hypothetical protein
MDNRAAELMGYPSRFLAIDSADGKARRRRLRETLTRLEQSETIIRDAWTAEDDLPGAETAVKSLQAAWRAIDELLAMTNEPGPPLPDRPRGLDFGR